MKKLLGLATIALMLSFATVSVGWAAPAQNHEQQKHQGKEQPKKSVKQPTSFKHQKPPGKDSVKTPLHHNRGQVKNNNRQPQGPARISAKTPTNHNRHQVKNNNRQPTKVAHDKIRPHEYPDRHTVRKPAPPHKRPHSDYRDLPANRSFQRHHSWHQHWPDNDNWHHRFRDWSWFISHRVLNIGACYADEHRERAVYVHFEPQNHDYLYFLESRYGHCTYRERHHRRGDDGWCYYWFSGDNVIAFFVRDNGYSRAYIWQRAEAESQAVALGILTPDLQIVYSNYDDDMPPDLAAAYTQNVLWATVDDE